MSERKMNIFLLFAITLVLSAAATLFSWPGGLLFCIINIIAFGMEALVLRFTKPEVLKRGLPLEHWWDRIFPPVIALCAVASAVLSVYDVAVAHFSVLYSFWTMAAGLILMMSAYLIVIQSLRAQAPHAEEKYGETAADGADRGPYDVVRHPVMLAVLLGGLSIPLFLGSGIGFIPIGILLVAVIVRVAAEDDWRFNNYEWFYDYTKEVSYRLIPFIW